MLQDLVLHEAECLSEAEPLLGKEVQTRDPPPQLDGVDSAEGLAALVRREDGLQGLGHFAAQEVLDLSLVADYGLKPL